MSASTTESFRIGTRGSALAVAQTSAVAEKLGAAAGADIEIVRVTTEGDTSRASLATLGGAGVFAGALRAALLAGECDAVVHSLKDLPVVPFPGLVIGAVPRRADARDVLCARDGLTLDTLPEAATVGTGSPRRAAQLRARRKDLDVRDIRGNVDTRLAHVADGSLDAVVLAAAGLERLGRAAAATEYFPLATMPSAPGQGALAIEVREGDARRRSALARALSAVNHLTTRVCVEAERGVLARLEAGCAAPIGAFAAVDDGLVFLTATVYAPDGTSRVTASHAATPNSSSGADLLAAAREVAERAADELLTAGARALAPLPDAG